MNSQNQESTSFGLYLAEKHEKIYIQFVCSAVIVFSIAFFIASLFWGIAWLSACTFILFGLIIGVLAGYIRAWFHIRKKIERGLARGYSYERIINTIDVLGEKFEPEEDEK